MDRKLKLSIVTALAIAMMAMPAVSAQTSAKDGDRASDSAECKGIIARLIEATNASFDHYSPSGDNVFLKSPDMVLSCTSHRLTGISLTWDASDFPSNAWFGLLAKARQLRASIQKNWNLHPGSATALH